MRIPVSTGGAGKLLTVAGNALTGGAKARRSTQRDRENDRWRYDHGADNGIIAGPASFGGGAHDYIGHSLPRQSARTGSGHPAAPGSLHAACDT